MANPIQNVYSKHLQKGLPGQLARPNAPFNNDLGQNGVAVVPGDGVYYDAGTNKWILPVSTATRMLVTHIVSFDPTSFNVDIGSPAGNNLTEVSFPIDSIVKLAEFGNFFVVAGETVENGDAAIYNHTTGKWIKYTPSAPTANDLRKKAFEFYVEPGQTVAADGIVEVRIPTLTYAFPVLSDFPTQTVKITMTAAEIKALRATPKELVAAQGANTLIEFLAGKLVMTYGSEVLAETADNLAVEYDDGSGIAISAAIETTGFIDQAADMMTNIIQVVDTIDALADAVNKNIALANIGDGEISGNASDDTVIDAYITYRVIDLS